MNIFEMAHHASQMRLDEIRRSARRVLFERETRADREKKRMKMEEKASSDMMTLMQMKNE